MDQESRNILVELEMEKAKKFLAQAKEMETLNHWDLAANRYYYACFHAVQALFIHDQVNSHTHRGLNARFGLNYIKTGKIDTKYGALLSTMEQIREKGDYNCKIEVTAHEVQQMAEPSAELISIIAKMLV